jgi:hypothetical protein
MVLLPKQVHLQKDVGAGTVSGLYSNLVQGDVQAASDSDRKERNVKNRRTYLLMVAIVV